MHFPPTPRRPRANLQYELLTHGLSIAEGTWDEVFTVIGKAHTLVHQRGVVRVQTSMRAGSRTDKTQSAADKVKSVERRLAEADK